MPQTEQNNQIERSLGRLEGKVDLILVQMASHFAEDKVNFTALDRRISISEKKIWTFAGMITALSLLGSYVANKLFS